MSVKKRNALQFTVFGMRHLLVHLEGYFDNVDCLDFYETSKLKCDIPYLLGSDFEVIEAVNMA